jgi:hypothetical protein
VPLLAEKNFNIEQGSIYVISCFKVALAKSLYKPVDTQFMIYFTFYTRVKLEKDPPTTFPKYIYMIPPFSGLESYAGSNIDFLGKNSIVTSFILHILPIIIQYQYLLISLPHQMSWVLLLIYLKSNKPIFLGQLHPTMIRDITIKDI